jgi:hypothetical protein
MIARLWLALRVLFLVLLGRRLSSEVAARLGLPPPPPMLPPPISPPSAGGAAPSTEASPSVGAAPSATVASDAEFAAGAVALLALLQREGRLLDFLQEPIDAFSDEEIGAAVRDIHKGCRKAVLEHFELGPVLPGSEETPVSVAAGFDPSAIRLVGNVRGEPPFRGTLRHHGWRSTACTLAPPPRTFDRSVVAPAEVEL